MYRSRVCVMISAGRQTDLQALTSSSSSSSERKQRNCLHICLHLHEVKRCRAMPFRRASIRLFFWGRCGDRQAAVRTRCIHAHFANVLLRRQTAGIRQGVQNLQADQVVDQFVRVGGSSGPTMCEAHRTSLASTCNSPQSSGNARHCLLTSVDSHRAGGNQETDVFRRTACGCRFEIG